MDPDFYIEESNPKKVFFFILIAILIIGGGCYYFYNNHQKNELKLKTVTIELGSKLSEKIEDYATGAYADYKLDVSNIHVDEQGNTDKAGEYSFKLVSNTDIKKGKLFVKDRTSPSFQTQNITVGVNEKFEPSEFLTTCDDLSLPCKVTYEKDAYAKLNEKEGTYDLTIIVSDNAGNTSKKEVKLTVSATQTLASKKEQDFEVASTSPDDKEWNNTFTYKFGKGTIEDSDEYQSAISEISSADYQSKYEDKTIKSQSIIVILNKYEYVIGFSVKLNFEDGTIAYVTN